MCQTQARAKRSRAQNATYDENTQQFESNLPEKQTAESSNCKEKKQRIKKVWCVMRRVWCTLFDLSKILMTNNLYFGDVAITFSGVFAALFFRSSSSSVLHFTMCVRLIPLPYKTAFDILFQHRRKIQKTTKRRRANPKFNCVIRDMCTNEMWISFSPKNVRVCVCRRSWFHFIFVVFFGRFLSWWTQCAYINCANTRKC